MPYRRSKPNNRCLLLDDEFLTFDFHEIDGDRGCTKDYDTSITGRFTCDNAACESTGWSSKKIVITIRMYPGDEYNARVYHQRCKSCNRLSQPILNETYAERKPKYSVKSNGPHKCHLCEGCKNGHCKDGLGDF
ncbi:zinc-binding domain-containing protein [Aspergillus parasiticus]|uniref:Zinc-binding domain-containing protein n=1 Tax=Aspergillus parasiticus TaxID=5067 RepID=A0A5N6E2G2_ASPPA|nr:zinc-binding domain-containing protein [Aspergillus parasiticus]